MIRLPLAATANSVLSCAFIAFSALGLGGCASQNGPDQADDAPAVQLQWPEPPNAPRFVYEAQLRNVFDIRKETPQERLQRQLTGRGEGSGDAIYRKPVALAARAGRIYVADAQVGAVFVFDVPRGRLFPMAVREPNHVVRPVALAIDDRRNVYVLDGSRRRVMVYDALGLFMFAVGDPAAIAKPAGVAVTPDGSRIFVVDRGSVERDDHKVIAYSPEGTELFRIGPRGAGPGRLNIPLQAAVSPDGRLYVLDSGNFRVQVFDTDGNQLSAFGSVGNGLGQFSRARSIATDPAGNIYVSDASFNNVQIFDPAGNLLMWVGSPDQRNLPGRFGLIAGIAVDETGRLYVADQFHRKIEVYRAVATESIPK